MFCWANSHNTNRPRRANRLSGVVEKKAGKMNVPVDNDHDNAPDASVVVAKRSHGVAVKRDGNMNHRVDNGVMIMRRTLQLL